MGALFGHFGEKGIDKAFQEQVRDYLKPGTSALFMVIDKATPDKAVAALRAIRRHRDQDLALRGGHEEAPGRPAAAGAGPAYRPGRAAASCGRQLTDDRSAALVRTHETPSPAALVG